MAQTDTGFPWQGHDPEQAVELSEKVSDTLQNDSSQGDDHSTSTAGPSVLFQLPRISTNKSKHNSKSRKRASSVKAPGYFIPQTRAELDSRLSYAPTRHFNVRTIPPWVRDAEEDDIIEELDDGVLDSPHTALVAQHNSSPANTRRNGRQEPITRQDPHVTSSGNARLEKTSRWITFARASAYPRENFNGERVKPEWLNENFTDYSKPWLEGREEDLENDGSRYRAFQRKRQAWYKRVQFIILRNPFVPLAIRLTVIVFAAIAIGLGASIYTESGLISRCADQDPKVRDSTCQAIVGTDYVDYYRDPSGLMAVIIDAVAIVYSFYIMYDEYFSKPLGLRSARAKVRLVLLDLYFIVFQSANLSLAFEALTVERGACNVGPEPALSYRFDRVCDRAEALGSVLLVSLVAWLLTFSVSILRLVERINTR